MRVLGHYSQDENLLNMFKHGLDTHGSTAVNMFELPCEAGEVKKLYPHLRQASKIINFLLMYGGGATALYEALKNDRYAPIDLGSKEYVKKYEKELSKMRQAQAKKKKKLSDGELVAQLYIDKYFTSYKGVAKFIQEQKKFAHRYGYVQTVLGRKRRLAHLINSKNFGEVGYAERLSVNSAIQGSASDITISAQIRIFNDERLKELGAIMILQVHDEIVMECPEENVQEVAEICKYHMDNCFGKIKLNVPMIAEWDSGDNYQQAK